jgi:hypothetical protein
VRNNCWWTHEEKKGVSLFSSSSSSFDCEILLFLEGFASFRNNRDAIPKFSPTKENNQNLKIKRKKNGGGVEMEEVERLVTSGLYPARVSLSIHRVGQKERRRRS